jgi:hypothetical protein
MKTGNHYPFHYLFNCPFNYFGALLAALSLAACGGRGGPAAPAPAPAPSIVATSGVPLNLQAASTAVNYDAASATAVVTPTGEGGGATASSGQGAKIGLTTDGSGNLSKIAFSIPMAGGGVYQVAIPVGAGSLVLSSPQTINFDTIAYELYYNAGDPGDVSYGLSQVAGAQSLSFSAYGFWASTGFGATGPGGTFAIGNLTPAASVPSTGSATFKGSTVGMGGATNGGMTDGLQGNVQITANFSTQSVTTSLTGLMTERISVAGGRGTEVMTPLPDLSGTSTISGNAYSGPIAGTGLSGTINGNFYGSAAQETAGVWQASGNGNTWVGSFGAK